MAYLALLVLLPMAKLMAQGTSVYSETFSVADGTTTSAQWTLDNSHCVTGGSNYHFNVTAQTLEGRNLGGEAVWRSSTMSIAAYQHVDISLDISRSGSLNSSDYVKTYYILDGGAETPLANNGNLIGAFVNCTATQTGLTGNTLQIVVRMNNNSAGKKQRFDNVTVTGSNPVSIPLSATMVTIDETCASLGNGSATLTVGGGTSPYTYAWSNNAATQNLASATQGTYSVTVTDAAGASTTASGTINTLPGMVLDFQTVESSASIADGLAKVTISGGAAPYTILWSNGTTMANNYYLSTGNYTVTITDANNCHATGSASITSSPATKLINEDFDGLFSNNWLNFSFAGNNSSNTWIVTNSGCSIDNYSLQITDNSNCTYDYNTAQDIITYAPVNAIGYDSLSLRFNWKNLGEINFDFGSVWYSVDSVNWNLIETGGNGSGFYENSNQVNHEDILLPDSLKNQLFYIGFNWNNDNSMGNDPGFIVDDIILTGRVYTATSPAAARPTCTWLGNGGIQWNSTSNWDCGHLPLATDNVVIPAGTTFKPQVIKPLQGTCYNLTIAANTSLGLTTGSRLDVHGDIQAASPIISYGTISMSGDSVQHITVANGSTFHDLTINNQSDTGVVLNNNITMDGLLTLMKGYVFTGSDTLIFSNPYPTTPAIESFSNYSHIVGNMRRYITPNYFGYDFPVGNMGDSSLHIATVLPNNLLGVNYLTASFQPLTNNDNRQLTAMDSSLPAYNRVCPEGVWVIEPDHAPSTGSYEVHLGTENINRLEDNYFAVLKRPIGGSAADWTIGGGTLPNLYDAGRTVASGYAKRSNLTNFSEFAIARIDTSHSTGLMIGNYHRGRNIVILNWNDSTFRPHNTRLLRSLDGENFTPINIPGITSSTGGSYKTSDDQPEKGIVFYQLESTDQNGKTVKSETITVNCVGYADDDLIVYPNPNKGLLNFHLLSKETNIDIIVSTLNGDIIGTYSSYHVGSAFDKQIDLTEKLASGTYLVRLNTAYESFFRKITVTK